MIKFLKNKNIVVDTNKNNLFARLSTTDNGIIVRMKLEIDGGIVVESEEIIEKQHLPLPQDEWEEILLTLYVYAIYEHKVEEVCFPIL